jgi:hypothetical protein
MRIQCRKRDIQLFEITFQLLQPVRGLSEHFGFFVEILLLMPLF